MQLSSTDTGTKRPFEPISDKVGIYVCGVTPYDTTHVGHLFTFTSYDILVRLLRYLDYNVVYVQNITDVDDDMMRKARELGTTWDKLAEEQVNQLQRDMHSLNIAMPTHFPKASEQVDIIIQMVERLVSLGWAYASNGSVYYEVRKDPEFGPPSDLTSYEEMLALANERGNTPSDPNKRDPLDFVLWQQSLPDEPSWPSPWGPGRPGWHIECSAMNYRYIGPTVDIHGGGYDLVFPHHPCERVQTERFTGVRPFVRFWCHVGMVRLGGEKMSKSLGNLVLAQNLVKDWSSNAIRLALANHHYSEAWDWEDAHLPTMQNIDALIAAALKRQTFGTQSFNGKPFGAAVLAALEDDLDTPRAIHALQRYAEAICAASSDTNLKPAQADLCTLASLLGLHYNDC